MSAEFRDGVIRTSRRYLTSEAGVMAAEMVGIDRDVWIAAITRLRDRDWQQANLPGEMFRRGVKAA
ncbi:hypothetical protein [Tateyamaria sp.]|uniref:hypothetical protein n=1 Tax=Tateyamaria sp. TaxID=1929288 RepID=UPI00329D26D9